MLEERRNVTQCEDNANRCKCNSLNTGSQKAFGNTATGVINNRYNTNNGLEILE